MQGAEILLAPHQTGGCDSPDPHTMGLVDRALWENRHADPAAIEAELRGPKGRGWLVRWLSARAHDNGLFLVFSNGMGVDDDEIRTGNAMNIDPYGRSLAETWKADDDMVVADLDASLLDVSAGNRWIKTRRPELYGPLTVPTRLERDTCTVRFDKRGVQILTTVALCDTLDDTDSTQATLYGADSSPGLVRSTATQPVQEEKHATSTRSHSR